MASLLRDRSKPSIIEAQIELAEEERRFIEDNLDSLLEDLAWKAVVPGFPKMAALRQCFGYRVTCTRAKSQRKTLRSLGQ